MITIRYSVILLILVFTPLIYAEDSVKESFKSKQFNPNDIPKINEFCDSFKNDLINDFGLIDTANVSKETFNQFETLISTKIKPGTLEFFEHLKAMGAENCSFNTD